jgi:hypothetical protein
MATPAAWSGADLVKRGWSFIRDLVALLRARPARDERFKTEGKIAFDVQATAISYGVSVPQLEAQLATRRLQTAHVAYAALALGTTFLLGWIWHALSSPWTITRVTLALYFLPFCAVFFLVAFYNALLNYQLRARRLASWREYLATQDRFWPN